MNSKLKDEIESFKNLWYGGYRTGHSPKRNQKGLEEYLKAQLGSDMVVLEIGCGGGQWSAQICDEVSKLYCVDVLSEEHNNFFNFVGHDKKGKIEYYQVDNFDLDDIPDNSLDYVFSYDVFCHISSSGINSYLKSLYKKCKKGCVLNIMYADVYKYFESEPEHIYISQTEFGEDDIVKLQGMMVEDHDGDPREGRWYWVGVDRFIEMCESNRFKILDRDINIDKTNPITIFAK